MSSTFWNLHSSHDLQTVFLIQSLQSFALHKRMLIPVKETPVWISGAASPVAPFSPVPQLSHSQKCRFVSSSTFWPLLPFAAIWKVARETGKNLKFTFWLLFPQDPSPMVMIPISTRVLSLRSCWYLVSSGGLCRPV